MPDNAAFDFSVVPAPMATGAYVSVTITMINTGDTTWTNVNAGADAQYSLAAIDATSTAFGTATMPLLALSVAPGQRTTFQATLQAPATPGSYAFQWQMKKGTETFGAATPLDQIDVVTQTLGTEHVATRVPACVRTSGELTAFIRLKNKGNTAWTWGDVRVEVSDPTGKIDWQAQNTSVPIGLFVPPEGEYTFKPTLTAPAKAGAGTLQAQLETFTGVAIGSPTPAANIRVSDQGGVIAVESMPVTATGAATRIEVDCDTSTFAKAGLVSTGVIAATAKKAFSFSLSKLSLFVLRFHAVDLATGKRSGEFQEYHVTDRKAAVCRVTDHVLELCWTLKPALGETIESRGRRMTLDPRIDVTVWVRGEHDRGDPQPRLPPAWLDLDIAFTYPEIDPPAAGSGWEAEILFPVLKVPEASNRRLLDGTGYLGPLADRKTKGERNTDQFPVPVQLAAVFEAPAGVADDSALRGIIVTGTDVDGHWKKLVFAQATEIVAGKKKYLTAVAFSLTNSIFVKATAAQPPYTAVRPDVFTLSTKDGHGFLGASMRYRISAFRLDSASINPGGTLSWHDVAALYRDQAKSSKLFKPRTAFGLPSHVSGAPLDVMAPHTVIANYALDGPVQVKDDDHQDGAPDDRASWMEAHPMVDGKADFTDSTGKWQPPSVEALAKAIQTRVKAAPAQVPLEVQVWGFEMGGFYYRFFGAYPPITDVLHEAYGDSSRFKGALADLATAKLWPIVTTTPFSTQWNGVRFRGHRLKQPDGSWQNALPWDWPSQIVTYATIAGVDASNRGFRVATADGTTLKGHTDALMVYPSLEHSPAWAEQVSSYLGDPVGPLDTETPRGLHAFTRRLFCPSTAAKSRYLDRWLGDPSTGLVQAYGLRLLEFMILFRADYFCYDASHAHGATAEYDKAIGVGLHYVAHLKSVLTSVLSKLDTKAAASSSPWSALTHEHTPIEALVPWVDEHYNHDTSTILVWKGDTSTNRKAARFVPIFHFVYSEISSLKMNLADHEPTMFPGYVEKSGTLPAGRLPGYTPTGDPPSDLETSFGQWRDQANTDAASFARSQTGIAPMDYTVTLEGGATDTYSYHRAAQSIFNLRSEIYRLGAAAVLGERILLQAAWFDGQTAYHEHAVAMGVAAAHMQMKHAVFFRKGWMLGPADIVWPAGVLRKVWAWRANKRHFIDVEDLAQEIFGPDVANAPYKLTLTDHISRGIDRRKTRPLNKDANPPPVYDQNEPPILNGVLITTDRVHHLVWQRPGKTPGLLYAFANIGDEKVKLDVIYARGTKGVPKWKRSVLTFDGKTPDGTAGASDTIAPGAKKSIEIPARNVVTVMLVPA